MSNQIVRIQDFPKVSLGNIESSFKNKKALNSHYEIKCFKTPATSFSSEWKHIENELNFSFKNTKRSIGFDGLFISAEAEFFKSNFAWVKGQEMSATLTQFWQECYDWAVKEIGFKGTDRNIILASVCEVDSLSLAIYYLPVTEKWCEKIYARGEDGKILKNENGSPIQATDENGRTIFKHILNETNPKLSKSEFWRARGGNCSYSQFQDRFYDEVGKRYGLGRGIVGKRSKHFSAAQYEHFQLKQEKDRLETEIGPLRQLRADISEINDAGTKLPFGLVAVPEKQLDAVKEQAKSYAANRDEIKTLRERSFALAQREQLADLRERQLDEKAQNLARQEQELQELYQQQLELNQLFEQSQRGYVAKEQEIEILQKQLMQLKSYVERQNGSLTEQLERMRIEHYDATKELTERLRGAYESITNIVKAVGMLKYDQKFDYKIDKLNSRQSRLIDAVAEYAAMWAKEDGFPEMAEDIEQYIGISKGIKDIIDPQSTYRTKNSDWEP